MFCCSRPVPQEVVFSVYPTMKGGTRYQRQSSSTENARDSSICASSGFMVTCLYSMPPSRSIARPAFITPAKRSTRLSSAFFRCSGVRIFSIDRTPPGRMPRENVAAAACSIAIAAPIELRANAIGERPIRPSSEKPFTWKISSRA